MKRSKALIIIMAMFSMTSCLVSSLHPFFKAKDKIFNPDMLGTWIDGDSCVWTIMPNNIQESFLGPERTDSTYQITYYDEDDKAGYFKGTLFQIKGVNYVDFYPDPDEDHSTTELIGVHHVPTHTLARVQFNSDSILIYWYGEEWLNELFEQSRIRIKHETVEISSNYSRHVLTASTDELQKFIKKYANDPKTVQDIENIFARGYTDDQEDYGIFLKLKPYDGKLPGKQTNQVQTE